MSYEEIAALTLSECKKCDKPFSCCCPEGCQLAENHLKKVGEVVDKTKHPTMPYMGVDGCILSPDQRPACARYCCALRDPKKRRENKDLHRRYIELTNKIGDRRGL